MPRLAVITLDFINDIAHVDGKVPISTESLATHQCIERANSVTAWARAQYWPVIHVKVGFSPSYAECPMHSPLFSKARQHQALLLDSWGTAFHEKLQVDVQDLVVTKHRVNAFYGTDLDVILRAQVIDTVVLAGISTQLAIESTARDAHDRDYRVIILSDACRAASQTIHEASLINLARLGRIVTCAEFLTEA